MISVHNLLETYADYPVDIMNFDGELNIFIPNFQLIAEDWEYQATIQGPGQYGWPKKEPSHVVL